MAYIMSSTVFVTILIVSLIRAKVRDIPYARTR